MSLERRDYETQYAFNYNKVDLKDYVTNSLTNGANEYEYKVSDNPIASNMVFLTLKDNLVTGTYKLVFKLYDNNTYIGEVYEYFIIK